MAFALLSRNLEDVVTLFEVSILYFGAEREDRRSFIIILYEKDLRSVRVDVSADLSVVSLAQQKVVQRDLYHRQQA